jgi:hypothetical protein
LLQPRRGANKEAIVLGTALARRIVKTPSTTAGRKQLNKGSSNTECQPKRAKPRPPPISHASPPHPAVTLPIHPPARTDDQALDFSLLHTMKNVHGQMKVSSKTSVNIYSYITLV